MTCTVNHLLIELGVSRRKLGHFVMEGRDKMKSEPTIEGLTAGDLRVLKGMISETHRKRMAGIDEVKRLRAVNAKLVEALEGLFTIVGEALIEGDFDEYQEKADIEAQHDLAHEAIEEARK